MFRRRELRVQLRKAEQNERNATFDDRTTEELNELIKKAIVGTIAIITSYVLADTFRQVTVQHFKD